MANIKLKIIILLLLPLLCGVQVPPKGRLDEQTYQEKAYAVWMAQLIGASIGWQFEHKQAAVKWVGHFPENIRKEYEKNGGARLDDDWYYEMGTLNAFQKYGPNVTVEQLGQQWLENRVGTWGAGEWARLNLEKGIKAPLSGHPQYNRMWFTMGNQARGELYGLLAPGMPNLAAQLSHELGHVSSYAEGTLGGVFVSVVVSLGFIETDVRKNLENGLLALPKDSPHYQSITQAIHLFDQGKSHRDICNAIEDKWHIEYPATNNTVSNMGIIISALLHGGGDFLRTINLAYQGGDFTDADNNAAISGAMLAAAKGLTVIPAYLREPIQNRIRGTHLGSVEVSPPVDISVTDLARQTVEAGRLVLAKAGVTAQNGIWLLPKQQIVPRPSENFSPNDFARYWNPEWQLERAGFGAPGGGHRGLRGGTFLDGDILSVFPRDETRGAYLHRIVQLGKQPKLSLEVAADPGRTWKLEVLVDHDLVHRQLVDGGQPLEWEGVTDLFFPPPTEEYKASANARQFESITLDLSKYAEKEVVIRVYVHTYVRNRYPGNAYFRNFTLQE